jgi:cell division protein FtsA
MSDKLICGIDIGSSKVATVVGLDSTEHNELRVIGFNSTASKGVKRGLIVDIEKVTSAVEESVEKAERMAGHKISRAFVSVGGPHISSVNSHGVVAVSNPQGEIIEADAKRVTEAARAISLSTTRQIIEVLPREYSVDGQSGIKNPIGMSGVRLEVDTHIITASLTNLKNIERCLTDINVSNSGFIFSGLASSESVLSETEKDLGVTVVDIGGGKMDLCIYVDGSLAYSSSIPIGAKHITNDIAVGLRVSLESAERIKLYLSKHRKRIEMSYHNKKQQQDQFDFSELNIPEQLNDITPKTIIEGIIGPRIEELYNYIGEEIEKSGFAKQIPSGVVLTGGGSLTIGIMEMGRKHLGLPIRIGTPERVTGLVDEILDPQFATTIGLILYGRNASAEEITDTKDFNKILKDFSVNSYTSKLKEFIKQFLP